ncbi:class I SAM-dependent methyltransferase [Pontibacter fetidus]|uniref:Class I SAM-dependent methyltransferase n=1 Tax=Pontibacter fetidus TaxID=2700082 RepID=A0A6B2GZM5_9BACT|nr:class I SAM-dependent methyltransferase [Pontibacter fetidus]NDK56439.1 class I SAM-dependent methyltransferase [Pontibacter fetidus]
MDARYEAKYHILEEEHWWFRSRRHMVYSIINELNLSASTAILEVGCSAGPLLLKLQQAGFTNLTGIDVSETAIALGNERGLKCISVMDGAKLAFPDATFDLVIASDVLEHIADDKLAMQEWARVLKPGGKLIVFVPAFQHLWSNHDVVNHHFKRYSKVELKTIVAQAGLNIKRASYWNFSLYFPTLLVRKLQNSVTSKSALPDDDLQQLPTIVNSILTNLVKLENKLLTKVNYPVGVSVFVVAIKA